MAKKLHSPDDLINTIIDSWCSRNRPESMNTDWGQSLLAYGMLRGTEAVGSGAGREYLRRWLTYHLGTGVHTTYFVGSWSIGLLYPEVVRLFPEFEFQLRGTAEQTYRFILEKAIRNGRGVILHNVDLPHIHIDTIYYTAPVLAKIGGLLGGSEWRKEALGGLRAHLEILCDPPTGLFIHCQENLSGRRSEGAWGRGNGWVAMTCAELLEYLKPGSLEWNDCAKILLEMVTRLLPYQTRSGLWRTIITDKTSYEETSASAMFLFAMLRGRRMGALPAGVDEAIDRCAAGLRRHVDPEGRFTGSSEGTWPGTVAYYKGLERGEWWWGTGAYLLALTELMRR